MKQSYNYQNLETMLGLQVSKGSVEPVIKLLVVAEEVELTVKEAKQLKSALAVAIDVATHNAEQK